MNDYSSVIDILDLLGSTLIYVYMQSICTRFKTGTNFKENGERNT